MSTATVRYLQITTSDAKDLEDLRKHLEAAMGTPMQSTKSDGLPSIVTALSSDAATARRLTDAICSLPDALRTLPDALRSLPTLRERQFGFELRSRGIRTELRTDSLGDVAPVVDVILGRLPSRSRFRALLIGNAAFDDPELPDLPSVTASLRVMSDLLTGPLCQWPEDRVTVIEDPTDPREVLRQIDYAARDAEALLVYVTGHAVDAAHGRLRLAMSGPASGRELNFEDVALLLRHSEVPAIVIVDCSFSAMALASAADWEEEPTPAYAERSVRESIEGAFKPGPNVFFLGATSSSRARFSDPQRASDLVGALARVIDMGDPAGGQFLTLSGIARDIGRFMIGDGHRAPVFTYAHDVGEFEFAVNAADAAEFSLAGQGEVAVEAFREASAAQDVVLQWSSKVLVVGEAFVGKTSLSKQLIDKRYDPEEPQTHGVHVDELELEHPHRPDTSMRLSLWDFGGQLEYRATQRFYLTDRSLFVLVWNSRARWRDGKVTAWLDVIAARAPTSSVLVVATHGDEPSASTLPGDLTARYPQIVGVHTVDSASGNGIETVRDAIRFHAATLPMMGAAWPITWMAGADAIRALPGVAATIRQVRKHMADAGVADPNHQAIILRWLHDLGEIVYFAEDEDLAQRVILHPVWLDGKITAVLDSAEVARRRGLLSRAERDRLWAELDDIDLYDRLLRMMEKFDLAYRIGDSESSSDVALVVERLDDARPAAVDELWREAGEDPEVREIGIAYGLRSRQAGIPTWFIARQHRFTTDTHWSHGTLLHDRDPDHPASALLTDDGREQPVIELRVRGRYPVRFQSVLAEAFEAIVERRYPGLIEQRYVLCTCSPRPHPPCRHRFALNEVFLEATDREPGADQRVRCPLSGTKLDARGLLDGLTGTTLEAAIGALGRDVHDLRTAMTEQQTTLEHIDYQALATLNGVRSLLDHRAGAGVHCPSLFEVGEAGRAGLRLRRKYRLHLWCEWPYGPNGPHPLPEGEGSYELGRMPDWLRAYVPFLSVLATALGLIVPLAAPGLAAAGAQLTERTKAEFEVLAKLAEDLGEKERHEGAADEILLQAVGTGPRRRAEVGADFRVLRAALTELDPALRWGGLSPVERPEDRRVVYLCREHVRALDYPYRG